MDMTSGALLPKILIFSGPLILTGILQLLYNAADVVVVGRFAGATSLAAVGSTGSLINLIINVFMGLSVGTSVMVARYYGAGDVRMVQDTVHTSILVALLSGIVVGIFGFVMAKPILRLMDSPDDVIDLAALYVRIYFVGMPFNLLYNFGAGILRAVGDTKRPLYYLTISGAANVILNLILVIVFHMGVAGVAIATVVSQAISMVLVLLCLIRTQGIIHLDLKKLRIRKSPLLGIMQVGLPAGLQGSLFSISNVLIQSSVNSFLSTAMAGNAAASNLEGFVYTAMNSIYQADLTFASQNYGAGKKDRVKSVLWNCLGTVVVIGLGLGLLFMAFDRTLLSVYNQDPAVIDFGVLRMHIILPTYFLCGMMDVMVGQLRGIGYSIMPMIVSLTGACLFRIVWIMTIFSMPQFHTLQNPEKETNFENCVADVNIPVGEVFTSPVLKGTNGILHVSQVYLEGLNFKDLEIRFKDGMIETASCANFETKEENDAYIRENILFHHESLPMGEFAIGTNTTAYVMARKYGIAQRLPILIAEKTGPHFAVGDTCYSWEEDNHVYNPDGKEIIAKENEVSAQRREDPLKAYFNCHTDITIPYEELGLIEVLADNGYRAEIISGGRFVLPGTEELNKPLES